MTKSCEADGLAIPAQDCAACAGESLAPRGAPVESSPPTRRRMLVCSKTSLGACCCWGGSGSFANHLSSLLVSDKYTFLLLKNNSAAYKTAVLESAWGALRYPLVLCSVGLNFSLGTWIKNPVLVWVFFSLGTQTYSISACKKNCLRLLCIVLVRCRVWKLDLEEH